MVIWFDSTEFVASLVIYLSFFSSIYLPYPSISSVDTYMYHIDFTILHRSVKSIDFGKIRAVFFLCLHSEHLGIEYEPVNVSKKKNSHELKPDRTSRVSSFHGRTIFIHALHMYGKVLAHYFHSFKFEWASNVETHID